MYIYIHTYIYTTHILPTFNKKNCTDKQTKEMQAIKLSTATTRNFLD